MDMNDDDIKTHHMRLLLLSHLKRNVDSFLKGKLLLNVFFWRDVSMSNAFYIWKLSFLNMYEYYYL